MQVSVLFGAASLACVASALRIYYAVAGSANPDFTWVVYSIQLWSIVESDIGLICGSLPACAVLLKSRQEARQARNPERYGRKEVIPKMQKADKISGSEISKEPNYNEIKFPSLSTDN